VAGGVAPGPDTASARGAAFGGRHTPRQCLARLIRDSLGSAASRGTLWSQEVTVMRLLLLLVAVALLPVPLRAGIITVDCQGGGDYYTLPAAMFYGTASDTVLVMPCTYSVQGSYWPIALHDDSPTVVGVGGAAVTILQGDGTKSAFTVEENEWNARAHISGLTFRSVSQAVDRESLDTGTSFQFTDNIIEDCAAGLRASSSGGLIARNVIRNNGDTGIGIYHCWATIEHNEIYGNPRGINGACCEEPQIRHNHIHHNTEYGVRTGFFAHIHDNTIEHNGWAGVSIYGAGGEIEHNVIRRNQVGIYVASDCNVSINFNDIYGNHTYAVEVSPYSSGCDLDATMNWWGTTYESLIEANILDCNDNAGRPMCVIYDPWCAAPGCETTAVEMSSWGSIKALYRQ